MLSIIFAIFAAAAYGQICKPDILIDDFSNLRQGLVEGNIIRNVNLLGGDYGTDGPNTSLTFVAKTADSLGYVAVRPTRLQVAPILNFFFIKQNAEACFDLTGYTGFQFEMSVIDPNPAPGNVYDSSFTLTQKTADCSQIVNGTLPFSLVLNVGAESKYEPISKYGILSPNVIRNYTLPLVDFSTRSRDSSENYDFIHFKDYTFNAFSTVNVEYRFYRFVLVGDCQTASTPTVGIPSNSAGLSPTATAGPGVIGSSGSLSISLYSKALVLGTALILATY